MIRDNRESRFKNWFHRGSRGSRLMRSRVRHTCRPDARIATICTYDSLLGEWPWSREYPADRFRCESNSNSADICSRFVMATLKCALNNFEMYNNRLRCYRNVNCHNNKTVVRIIYSN